MQGQSKTSCWVGFDLGATKMLAVVFDADFERVGERRRRTRSNGVEQGIERIASTIAQALENAHRSADDLAGIGIGCPGPLDLEEGVLLETPNLGWPKTPLKKGIAKKFNCPVFALNDADAGLYGEYRFGAVRNARCAVAVFPGTGIGGSCIYEGRIITGKNRSCFEIGHLQVVPGGPICGCGQHGCLEAVASRLAIAAAAGAAACRGEAPHLLAEAGTDLKNMRSTALSKAIEAGDTVVDRIVRDAAAWLGIGVAGVIHLMAPDMIVLGGGLVEAMPRLFQEEVERAARCRVMPAFRDSFKVVVAKLGDYATAIGAAAWARDQLAARNGPQACKKSEQ